MVAATAPQSLTDRLTSVHVGVRPELEISRHIFNGEPAYVVRDPVSFQTQRLTAEDYQIFCALNADEELGMILTRLTDRGVLAADQAESFYEFVLRLTQYGLLTLPVSDGPGLYQRFKRRRSAEARSKLTGFLSLRVPLISPDAFLTKTMHWCTPLFSTWAFLVWLLAMIVGGVVVHSRWQELWDPIATIQITTNLPALWTLLVVLKVLHEFGHAYACKRFGGYVPEMGVFMIFFTPSAYVDASASWGFPSRRHRIIVALGGMYFESMIALLALAVWCMTPPGPLHSMAQYSILLSTAITIGFNANPLMKYDGYYVLSDLLGMPNLRADSQFALQSMLKRFLFGIPQPPSSYAFGRQILLMGYGLASMCYKVLLVVGISLMLLFKMPVLGFGLAAMYLFQTLRQSAQGLMHLYQNPENKGSQKRIFATVAGILIFVMVGGTLVPVPGSVNGMGVLERSDDQTIRAEATGFLAISHVKSGDLVSEGQPLCDLINADLDFNVVRQEAIVQQLEIQLLQSLSTDRLAAQRIQESLAQGRREYHELIAEQNRLRITVRDDGQIAQDDGLRFQGRFVHKGDPLAKITSGDWQVKTLITAEDLFDVAPIAGASVDVCLTGHSDNRCCGRILTVARAGSRKVSDESLTHAGGGDIPVNAGTKEAGQSFFEVTISVSQLNQSMLRHGRTAVVRFSREPVSLAMLLYRRSLLLLDQLRIAG